MGFEATFCQAEEQAFGDLFAEHGFVRAEQRVGRRAVGAALYGRVVYRADAPAGGLGRTATLDIAPLEGRFELQLSKWASGAYTIEELHALDGRGPFPPREHALFDAMIEPAALFAELTRLADAFRRCGDRFFDDDPDLWRDLQARRDQAADAEAMTHTLALAQERFRGHDWAGVVALLAPIEARLGRTATARLMRARRKLATR